MESMIFQVSAKTARLIGRENISDVDGAVIELVKNGYDADAECVFVKYHIPFDFVPEKLTLSEVKKFFAGYENLIDSYYKADNGNYVLNKDVQNISELELYIKSLAKIIILDNGSGMTKDVLQKSWMNIGTDNKEKNIFSKKKNRVRTGAKGIGRFALDKLSIKTTVFTKSVDDDTYIWKIDWQQFENAELLNQVEATLDTVNDNFNSIVKDVLGNDYNLAAGYNWTSGTIIVLSPIRSFWAQRMYTKVNSNIRNINPLGNVDKFDVHVINDYHHEFDYSPEDENITRENYDYMIDAEYDGNNTVKVVYDRNEINIGPIKVSRVFSETDKEEYDIEEFWGRDAFKKEKYTRKDFDGKQEFTFSLEELVPVKLRQDLNEYKSIGPFFAKFYYLKNKKSTVEVVKDLKTRKREKLLNDFSGIKIYRDSFKVRPYGDQGQFYDWLGLSIRQQASPAAASHPTGKWRVSPNQLIGSVAISRIKNPNLHDNANREGMNLNREFDCFVDLIDSIISKFEYDRQYALREFALWIGEKEKRHKAKAQEIYEQVMRENAEKEKKNRDNSESKSDKNTKEFTKDELKDAIVSLGKEKEKSISNEQLMMVLSATGVMAQTFSHEITRIETDLGSRGQHLRASIDMLLDHEPYTGDEDFNPYEQIEELDNTDLLLSEWVGLIMDSVDSNRFAIKMVNLKDIIEHILDLWKPLLKRKYIEIDAENLAEVDMKMPEIDMHLLVNNFLLNSAYFLEEAEGERKIDIELYLDKDRIILDMKNNGPLLDSKYRQMPDESLDARETSKEGGTGLGLWIAKEAMIRNDGELHVIPIDDGYMLRASWKK